MNGRSIAGPAGFSRLLWFLVALSFLVAGLRLFTLSDGALVKVIPDDAFYYLKIAFHIAAGDGSTFDGINPTNGYHPLWMILLLPLAGAVSAPFHLVYAAIVTQMILCAMTALALWRTFRRSAHRAALPFAVLALLAFPLLIDLWLNLLESAIALLLLALLLDLLYRLEQDSSSPVRDAALLGLVAAALTLAKLDLGVAIPVVAVYLLVRRGGDLWWTGLGSFGTSASLPVAAYLLYNYFRFGHLATISGYVKTAAPFLITGPGYGSPTLWGNVINNLSLFAHSRMYGSLLILVILSTALLAYALARRKRHAPPDRPLLVIWIFAVLHFFSILIFQRVDILFPWYFVTEIFALALGLMFFMSRLPAALLRPARVTFVVLLLAASAGWYFHIDTRDENNCSNRMYTARWANVHLPPGSVIGSWDAGAIGFFCMHPVVNLEGLTNSFAFVDYVRAHGLKDYVLRSHITHVANEAYVTGDFHASLSRWRNGLARPLAEVLAAPVYDRRFEKQMFYIAPVVRPPDSSLATRAE